MSKSFTTRQIAAIARATNEHCYQDGWGQGVAVFANGDYSIELYENGIDRYNNRVKRVNQIAYLRKPMTVAQVGKILRAIKS